MPDYEPLKIDSAATFDSEGTMFNKKDRVCTVGEYLIVLSNLAIAESNLVRAKKSKGLPHFLAIVKHIEGICAFSFEKLKEGEMPDVLGNWDRRADEGDRTPEEPTPEPETNYDPDGLVAGEITHNMERHELREGGSLIAAHIRELFKTIVRDVSPTPMNGRCKALVMTKLEEALDWAIKGIVLNDVAVERAKRVRNESGSKDPTS